MQDQVYITRERVLVKRGADFTCKISRHVRRRHNVGTSIRKACCDTKFNVSHITYAVPSTSVQQSSTPTFDLLRGCSASKCHHPFDTQVYFVRNPFYSCETDASFLLPAYSLAGGCWYHPHGSSEMYSVTCLMLR